MNLLTSLAKKDGKVAQRFSILLLFEMRRVMSSEVICAIISGIVTLIVSTGTWQVSVRQDRNKAKEELRSALTEYYEKNRTEIQSIRENDLQEIRNDLVEMRGALQQEIAVIKVNIGTLSERVDKHNNVIDRTYKLEQASALHEEQIKTANHRIDNLEDK